MIRTTARQPPLSSRCRWLAEPIAGRKIETKLPVVSITRGPVVFESSSPAVSACESVDEASLQLQVLAQQFSPFILQRVDEYAHVGSRDVYLWRWCLHGLGLTTLSCVAPNCARTCAIRSCWR